jgi:hypothetical protein
MNLNATQTEKKIFSVFAEIFYLQKIINIYSTRLFKESFKDSAMFFVYSLWGS